jgi:hypothetical protein
MPPTPIMALVIWSLGAVKPGPPSTCRGTMVKAAAPSTLFFKKSLLSMINFWVVIKVKPNVGIQMHYPKQKGGLIM